MYATPSFCLPTCTDTYVHHPTPFAHPCAHTTLHTPICFHRRVQPYAFEHASASILQKALNYMCTCATPPLCAPLCTCTHVQPHPHTPHMPVKPRGTTSFRPPTCTYTHVHHLPPLCTRSSPLSPSCTRVCFPSPQFPHPRLSQPHPHLSLRTRMCSPPPHSPPRRANTPSSPARFSHITFLLHLPPVLLPASPSPSCPSPALPPFCCFGPKSTLTHSPPDCRRLSITSLVHNNPAPPLQRPFLQPTFAAPFSNPSYYKYRLLVRMGGRGAV